MRVVIDARESGTSTGRYVDKLVEHLYELKPDFEMTVLTKSPRLDFMKNIAPGFEIIKSDFKEFTFSEQLGFLAQLNSLGADLVHFTMPQQPVRYKGRAITTFHDLTTARFTNPDKNPAVFKSKQLVYKRVINQVAKKSIHLIAISQYTKADLVNFTGINPNKVTVIYEAADKILDEPKQILSLKNKQFLLYVGRSTPHKNLQRALLAFKIVLADHPDLLFVMAGKIDDNYRRLQSFAKSQKIDKHVVLTDFVNDSQLRWLYENAELYVFPSLSEGFGLPGLEAMQYALPVVSSNATCLPEIYKDAAEYFDPLDVNDIANKILGLLGNDKKIRNLTGHGLALGKEYSWGWTAKQTLDVYTQSLP